MKYETVSTLSGTKNHYVRVVAKRTHMRSKTIKGPKPLYVEGFRASYVEVIVELNLFVISALKSGGG